MFLYLLPVHVLYDVDVDKVQYRIRLSYVELLGGGFNWKE